MFMKRIFLAPVYGLNEALKENIQLDKNLLLRSIDIYKGEDEKFKKIGLMGSYGVLLEINYRFDQDDSNEPFPGILINIINKFEAALLTYGEGVVGVAAIITSEKPNGTYILNRSKTHFQNNLKGKIDKNFVDYYQKFIKAYDLRPMAFDIYTRSRSRFANNDKTIDICTILESIFVPNGQRLKKPFIVNGVKIMGFTENEIKAIDELIDLRNALIHADSEKLLRLVFKYNSDWFDNTFNLVRRIIYKYAENPWN